MRLLLSSDWHLDTWSAHATTLPDGRNSRLADQLNVLDQILHYVEAYEPDVFVFGGDFTHRRRNVLFSILTPGLDVVDSISRRVKRTILVVGNHDWEDQACVYSSLDVFRHRETIDVVDRPIMTELSGHRPAIFVPFLRNEASAHALRDVSYPEGVIAFAHYAATGVTLPSGFELPTPLRRDDLDRFAHVFFSHVHTPSSDGHVTYNGAPYHMDFGDAGGRHCLFVNDDLNVERLSLYGPRFVTTTYPDVPDVHADGGFLRVLAVPHGVARDVQKLGGDRGWTDVVTSPEELPTEAVAALSTWAR